MNDHRKTEIINAALLERADQLEQSVAYWKAETDKAWEAAKRWRDEEAAKAADVRENMDALCRQIEAIGARIPVNTGGTMERDPCDAILGAVERALSSPNHRITDTPK